MAVFQLVAVMVCIISFFFLRKRSCLLEILCVICSFSFLDVRLVTTATPTSLVECAGNVTVVMATTHQRQCHVTM